jgi:two-component sensor histidine kinase
MDIATLKLSITQAIPVVLILNEAVTNSIKHAFTGRSHGEIRIHLHKQGNRIILSVSDNGIGLNPVMGDIELNSLGLRLMKGLSRELGGDIFFENKNGTAVIVNFESDITGHATHASEAWQHKEYTT